MFLLVQLTLARFFPQNDCNNQIITFTLKKRISFKSYVYFETVRPEVVLIVLKHLQAVNPLYYDI